MHDYDILKEKKILYAEDDEIANVFVSRILKKNCKEVVSVNNGKEALGQFKTFRPDAIITDLAMPVMSGTELIHQVLGLNSEIPILIITAFEDEVESIGRRSNIGHITKPIDKKMLLNGLVMLFE